MKRFRTRLGVLLTAAIVITGIPVPAMAYVAEDTLVQEASLLEESRDSALLDADVEADGVDESLLTEDVMSDTLMQFEEEEGAEMSLKSLADQYDTAYNDTTGEDLKIIYVSDNQTSLSSDAAERLEKADEGRDRIKIGEDGVVTQVFNRDDEDKLAPNVYVHEDGKKARGERTWYATVKGETFIGSFNSTNVLQYCDDGPLNPYPGYRIAIMGDDAFNVYKETDVKKYLSADSIVKQAQTYQSSGIVRLYPNWQTPVDVIFDEESLKGVENPNSNIIDYVTYETLKLDPLENIPGYDFKGWKYKYEGETVLKEATAGTGEDEGKFLIDTQNNSRVLTVYADWDPKKYSITYKGVKVVPVSGNNVNSNAGNDTFMLDGVEMAVVADGTGDVIDPENPSIGGIELPTYFTVDETTTLPTADQINANLTNLDPDFTAYNEFMCWSRSRKFKKIVNTLGKNGDVSYGDTTLYVIYTSREPIPELSANTVADRKEFKAEQINTLDLLDTDDYAIIDIIGTSISAEPDTVVLSGNAAKYFELCKVDARKAGTGHGYATVGIKLRDKDDEGKVIDDAVVSRISKTGDMRKLTLMFTGTDKRKDEKGEPVLYKLEHTLKASYKLPKYKLKKSKGTIYTAVLGENEAASLLVSEKEGNLTTDSYGGSWEADYVVKKGKTYETVPASKISVNVKGNDFVIEANMGCKNNGNIRLRNTDWVKGAYVYLPYNIAVHPKLKGTTLELTDKHLLLNAAGNNEVSTTTVTFKDGMMLDPSKIHLDTSGLQEGISADYKNGTIIVKKTGTVNKKSTLRVIYDKDGIKPVNLTIKVTDTKPEKAVKMTVKGKLDALMGGSLYLVPKVTGYAGTIKDVSVVTAAGKTPEFDTVWSGGFVELYSTDDYKPSLEKREINLNVTMTTGQVLPYLLKVTPSKGSMRFKVYNATIKVSEREEGDTGFREVTVYTPVIATYTYDYYTSPTTKAKRIYTIDLTRDSSADIITFEGVKGDNKNEIAASYSKGVIALTNKIDAPEKAKTYKLTVTGVIKPFKNNKISASYNVLLSR